MFPHFFPKETQPEIFSELVQRFLGKEDHALAYRHDSLKIGVEGTIALVAASEQNVDWAKAGNPKGMNKETWKALMKNAKTHSKKILAFLNPKSAASTSTARMESIHNPNSEKTRRFAKMQESCRKDVERGFGVLQARWAIVRHPARTWSLKTMHEVMTCCVIMHNMNVENEGPDGRNENHWDFQGELVAPIPGALSWEDYLHMNVEVTDDAVCKRLQTDLIEHQWALAGDEDNA
ncbi:hypothetical protein QYE76_001269 [Lolium multiflorum]|uniref:DDE Tnp4 domain-containing protein n=1 Tax=Lolium multiflorum TaxID=4521 RepID=A0AAD8RKV4_LOLMU|nr:hypothetical protein QYE76_001269 [Lolium multiflorum]